MGATAQRMSEARRNAKQASKRAKLQQEEINGAQWVRLRLDLLRDPKFKQLSGGALKIFFELFANYNGVNNGSLSLVHTEAETELNLSRPTISRAFKELEAKGFIRITRRGHFKLNNLYALTCFKIDEINEIQAIEPATRKAPDDWKQAP